MRRPVLLACFLICATYAVAQQTWTSATTGLWTSAATWTVSGGAAGVPPATLTGTQRVFIQNGHVVTQTADVILDGSSIMNINSGGKLVMGSPSSMAPTFTQRSTATFVMHSGIYESFSGGSGGDMLVESGTIDWVGSSVYVSGNYTFKDASNVTMINNCQRAAQNILFEGVGSAGSRSVMNNSYILAGVSGTGNVTFSSSCFIDVTNIRIRVGSVSGYAEFINSSIVGSIYSIYGSDKIVSSALTGSPELAYYCANLLDPNLNSFSGPKVLDCPLTLSQGCEPGTLYNIQGSIFRDDDAGTINGVGVGSASGIQLYASAVTGVNTVQATMPVNSDGTYSFANLGVGAYSIVLHTSAAGATSAALPVGWSNTAEGTSSAGDGAPNGRILLDGLPPSVINANFGITGSANLSVIKTSNNANPIVGQNITFTISVSNAGPAAATEVVVNDILPAGFTLVSATPSIGTWAAPNWTFGPLGNGASATLLIEAAVNGTGPYANTATVSSDLPDPATANNTSTAAVTPNVPPVAVADGASAIEDNPISFSLITNDNDAGGINAASVDLDPTSGGLQTTFTVSGQGTFMVVNSGVVTFTPVLNFNGAVTPINYTVEDNLGVASNPATITIFVESVNDEPSFVKGPDQTADEDQGAQTVLGWAGSLNTGAVNEYSQVLVFSTSNNNNALFSSQPVIDSNGTLTYTPAANAYGVATVQVILKDDGGTSNGGDDTFATQTFTITINPINDAPVLANLNAAIGNDAPFLGNVFVPADMDPDGTALAINTTPISGPAKGSIVIDLDGSYTYTPNLNFAGADVVAIQICDNGFPLPVACTTKTITFTLSAPPIVTGASVSIEENAMLNMPVHTVEASDPNPGDLLAFSITSGNLGNAFAINPSTGSITVSTPSLIDFESNPVFTLTVHVIDLQGNIATAIVTVKLIDSDNEDTDGDGILDALEKGNDPMANPIDTDNDGILDFRDTDSDNDGVADSVEKGNNGAVPKDSDTDQTPDYRDTDDDNDGLATVLETGIDSDGDGALNFLDDDDDNDGELTLAEDKNKDGNYLNDDCDADDIPDFLDKDQCKLKPELGFSPNGDDLNPKWIIVDIDKYPNNSVRVFNRWGNQVYEVFGYDNRENAWEGESKGSLSFGDLKVPDGTYFYVIDLGDGSKPVSGYVIVQR
jgi:uncharacterized repeat protein (TIGR01451 family)/gliding motility-associated-like protein